MLLQAVLGLSIDPVARRVTVTRGLLPTFLPEVRLDNLQVGDGTVDLLLERHRRDVSVLFERNDADAELVVVK
jgi:hypothetical protein